MAATPPDSIGRTIEKEIYLHATPERVWRALVDSGELARWFMEDATFDARPGGAATFVWDHHAKRGTVLEADPPRRLVYTWDERPRCDGVTTLTFTLTPEGDGTRVHLRHTGFGDGDDWDRLYREIFSGWDPELVFLRAWIERGAEKHGPGRETRHDPR